MVLCSFFKYAGCGNDFLIFDNRLKTFPPKPAVEVIQTLCHRQKGIGADGVLLLENSANADYLLRIFNSDGSEPEMCGNGLRCFVKYLVDIGDNRQSFCIKIKDRILTASPTADLISVDMGTPRGIQWNLSLKYDDQFLKIHSLNTGVPHAVLFVDNIEQVPVVPLGRHLRNYSLWDPFGTNATFAQVVEPQRLKIRTYERGVEGETLACGTGASAAALAAAHQLGLESPIVVETKSGEELFVEFIKEGQHFTQVKMSGPATFVFKGEIVIDCRLNG